MAGKDAKLERLALAWDRDQTGYGVRQHYRVGTPWASFELRVVVQGTQRRGQSGKRDWQVISAGNEIVAQTFQPTAQGLALERSAASALTFLSEWLRRLSHRELDSAYLDTLPPAQRESQAEARRRCGPGVLGLAGMAVLPGLTSRDKGARAWREGLAAFHQGGLLRLDPVEFWVDKQFRADIATGLKAIFDPSVERIGPMQQYGQRLPEYRRRGKDQKEVVLLVPIRMAVGQMPGTLSSPRFSAEGVIHLAADAPDRESFPQGGWRVAQLEMLRGHSAAIQSPGAPGS
jgi:hypothetical protein